MCKSVYIVIVNYNNYVDTIECVESLKNIDYKNFKIIIVDNNSINESAEKLSEMELDGVIVLQSNRNLGFAGGNNIGIKFALENGAEYILLLNNDTTVEKNFLEELIKTAESDSNIGMVACKIKYHSNNDYLWFAGGQINWTKFIGEHIGIKKKDYGQFDFKKYITFSTGCCMLIKREVFEKVGFLDENYFMYFEDVDFCAKVQKVGYKIIYEPCAIIYHKVGMAGGGEESPFTFKWMSRNRIYFMFKFKNEVSFWSFVLSLFYINSKLLVKSMLFLIKGDRQRFKAIIEGLIQGYKSIRTIK